MRNENEISELISMLSENMVYMLGNSEETIELSKELDFIQNYIELNAVIADKEIELISILPERTENIVIPKFVLQPIIENSIRHGFGKNQTYMEITVGVEEHEQRLKIYVSDSGIGCNAETLNAFINGEAVFAEEKIGIRNVSQRLKLLYGENYGLKFKNDAVGHIVAEITVPKQAVEEQE